MKALTIIKLITTLLMLSPVAHADLTLDSLLNQVKQGATVTDTANKKREAEFLSSKNKQKALLLQAKAELKALEKESARLRAAYDVNEKKLIKIETELNIAKGTLGEMFGVVRQVAGDLKAQITNSVTSAEITGRKDFLTTMSKAQTLPGIPELEKLWFELQREMTATGKITQFEKQVVQADGTPTLAKVTRVGAFNLLSEDSYLEYQGSTGQVTELSQQPSGKWTGLIEDFTETTGGFESVGIDPSRGAILGMLIQTPGLMERVQQGGFVGYVILSLLLLGLVIVVERVFTLTKLEKEMQTQLASDTINEANPIGKIMATYEKYKKSGLETLELKLDEAVIKATPQIKKGIGTVKILAGVAPLLGLLGTVTGMILTFQSITLFGTGDPKLMAGGISQALMTTVLGLVCAIPLILLHNYISNKSQNLIQILEEESVGMMASRNEGATP